jgi:hypothetical protein
MKAQPAGVQLQAAAWSLPHLLLLLAPATRQIVGQH